MKLFGLVSLLLAVGIGVWLVVGGLQGVTTDGGQGQSETTSYQEALEAARAVPGQVDVATGRTVTIYTGIAYPPNTVAVDLSNQRLSGSLQAEIRQLTQLEVLDISHNGFTGLPAELGQLQNLRTLNVSHNPLTGLPRELGQLKNLEVLDVRATNYSVADLNAIRAELSVNTTILTD